MRQIGNLPDEKQARLFGDFLIAQGIRNEIEPDHNSWAVWIIEEEQLPAGREMLDRFRKNPSGPEFARAAGHAEKVRAAEAKENAEYRKRFYTHDRVFRRTGSFGSAILTYSLVAICVAISLLSKFGADIRILRYLYILDPLSAAGGFLPQVQSGQIWRLFTPALIHFGVLHLLFDMLWLAALGAMIEVRQGTFRLALLVLVIAVVSNLAEYVFSGNWDFGGMSGVVYGLFGYIWLRSKFDPGSGLYISRENVILMVVWFFACFTGMLGPIANGAHASGLILGAAWGYVSALIATGKHG